MITREQVADLQPGDVVTYAGHPMLRGASITGPLYKTGPQDEDLRVGDFLVRYGDGSVNRSYADRITLAVVSRAPRPLYVNHPRTEPKHGDIVVDKDGDAWQRRGNQWFLAQANGRGVPDISDCAPLALLWDGETGQVVQ